MLNDESMIKIKHEVIYQVAKHAFIGDLEEYRDQIPHELIPGPQASFRCCIYKEREIIRERVRVAMGKTARQNDDGNIIQIINAACEDCPISSYVVTDNCQNCLGKACINSCPFGAIRAGHSKAHIDPHKCKECGKCAQACPFGVIVGLKRPCKSSCPVDAITYDEFGISVIDEKKCIRCGQCVHKCPFGAITTKTFIVNVIEAIKSDKPVYAIVAPATEGQFGVDITMESWRQALKDVGFTDMIEAGLGADLTTQSEAEEWHEALENGENKTTSCCPAFVNMVRKHYPELSDNISTTVSPMCMSSRYVKAQNPDAVTVFIGPCYAKKSEVVDQQIEGNADYVLTYSEIRAIFRAKEVTLKPAQNKTVQSSKFAKRYGNSGGVTASVLQYMKEMDYGCDPTVCVANGAAECKRALLLMKAGRLKENFIEGMACEGGCVGGPSSFKDTKDFAATRNTMIEASEDVGIIENLNNQNLPEFKKHR